ncbi:hypothetical protein E2562_006570 [Oryza meyeriana var. granulata]|uniref:DUF4408 domain-containing protein n=1 Tax=Oryza meyeriana var. granulata TaxID=110450 RepID=A0A6G1EHZ1_9ORYZ|nr:hypothetical protein E2562_006570 [Oryza meyeriana var. granulata]
MAVAGAALRLRLLYRMLRVGELFALVVFLSWSSSRVPAAAAAVVRLAGSLLLNARFVFVLGNAIVLLLLALSRHDLSISSNHAAAGNGSASSTPASTALPAASFPAFIVPQPSPPPPQATEAPAAAAPPAPVVPCAPSAAAPAAAAVFEDKQAVRVNKARAPRRSRSEKMGPRGAFRRAASPELRRSESERCRRRRSLSSASPGDWGVEDDNGEEEEFRRAVEAFIAKQQTRFHREESFVLVAGAGDEMTTAVASAAVK